MAGLIPQPFIDQLLDRVDIVELINSRLPLKKAGREYQACCPFHNEKTPSFTVSREKQFYHCFGCGAHGSAIGFLMEYDNSNFVEAVEELAAREGLEVPREGVARDSAEDHRPLYDTMEKASRYYQQQLRRQPQATRAVDYLRQRGLSGEIAGEFAIGYAPPGWHGLIQSLGESSASKRQLQTCGLISEGGGGKHYDRFRDRIMFPIRNQRGQTIAFGGRILGDEKPKYMNSPETKLFHKGRELYGLYEMRKALRKPRRLLVVEGYMDVVALAQFGIRYAVATLGTATTSHHLERLFRIVSELVFCFDGDRAGREAAWKAMQTALPLMQDGREIRFLFLAQGEDPDSQIRNTGADAFERQITDAQPLSTYLFEQLSLQVDMRSLGGRARLAEQAKPLLEQLPAGIFRRMMFKQLEQLVGVEVSDPKQPAGTYPQLHARPSSTASSGSFLGTMPPVRRAIALLIANPGFAQRQELPRDWRTLSLPGIQLLKELLEILESQPNLTTASLLERWRGREEDRHLSKLAAMVMPLPKEEQWQEFRDTLTSLGEQALLLEWEALVEKAAHQGLDKDEKRRLGELSQEKAQRDLGES